MYLGDIFDGEGPYGAGIHDKECVTFNPTPKTMGFTGISSITVPMNQELFDEIMKINDKSDGEIGVKVDPTTIKFYDAWNNEMEFEYEKVSNAEITLATTYIRFAFSCNHPDAADGVLKSNILRAPGVPRTINPTEYC